MNILPEQLVGKLHHPDFHKYMSDFTGAIAGLASAVAVLFGLVAAHFGSHGFGKVAVMLHMRREPLIVRLAPIVAGVAVIIAAASGLLRFYSWCRERREIAQNVESASQ